MCQLKELGGKRCSGHIKESIDNNNFTYNKLIVTRARETGDGETIDKLEENVALQAEIATEYNEEYLAKTDSTIELEQNYERHADRLNTMLQKNATTDQIARYMVENTSEYRQIRADYENSRNRYKDILKNGNKLQIAIAKRQMIQRRNETMDAIKPIVDKSKVDAQGLLSHGNIQKTSLIQEQAQQLDMANAEKDKLYKKLYTKNEQKVLEKEIRQLKNYSEIVQSMEQQPTRKARVCNDRQKELFRQYTMTSEYTKALRSKIEEAQKAGKKERVLRLSAEYESIMVASAKEQYDNIKSSKTPRKRSKLAPLKEEHTAAMRRRDDFMQQHVDYIQETRAAA